MISGVFGFALGDTLYFAALPRCGVQVAAMVSLVHVPATVLLDRIFLGHALASATLVFMLVVVIGVWLVISEARGGEAKPRSTRRAGVVLAIVAALSQAIGVVLGHEGMEGSSLLGGTLVRMFGGILGALAGSVAFGLVRGRTIGDLSTLVRPLHTRAVWPSLALAAFFGSIVGLPLFHFGLRELPSGVASVLFATTPLFTLPLGYFFDERHGGRAILGTAIGFAGVAGVVTTLA